MFDENKIKNHLNNLSFRQKIVFAASCCERLLPFYFAFSKIENWGNQALLQTALDKIWEISHEENFSVEEINNLLQYCSLSAPDSEDFASPYTFQAQNVCIAISLALEYCYKKEDLILIDLARVSYESVEMYLQIVNDPILDTHAADSQFDKWIENAPLLLAEMRCQQEDLNLLLENELDGMLIEKIRLKSLNSGVNPEKRGLL